MDVFMFKGCITKVNKPHGELLNCQTEGWVTNWATLWFSCVVLASVVFVLWPTRFLCPWDSSGSFLTINIMYHWYCPRTSFLHFFSIKEKNRTLVSTGSQADIMPVKKASHSGMARSWGTRGPSKRAVPFRPTWLLACVNTATHCPGFKDFFSRAPRFLNFCTTCPNFRCQQLI